MKTVTGKRNKGDIGSPGLGVYRDRRREMKHCHQRRIE